MISRHAEVRGIRMRWIESGAGFPVVMIHGIPTSPELWRHVMPRLPGLRGLAWEMVGFGDSVPEGRGRDISLGAQADYLAAWIDHLGLRPAILVGHDLGGGVAQLAAASYPGLCAGLLLTNAVGYDSWPVPSVSAMRAMSPMVRHLPDSLFKQILRSFMIRGHETLGCAEESLRVHWRHYRAHGGAAAFARQVEALRTTDTLAVADDLPTLGIPARIVWGAADQFQTIGYGERFARDLRAPLRRIETGKHFTPEDHPQILAEEIARLASDVAQTVGTRPARAL